MGVFNKLFRTHTKIDGAELCKFRTRHGLATGESGVELQLKFLVMGRNLPIIIPLWALKGMKEFKGADGNFSLEMVKGCNVLFQIETSSEYKAKKAQIEGMKKAGISKGQVVDMAEFLKKKKVAEKAKKEAEKKEEEAKKAARKIAKKGKRAA